MIVFLLWHMRPLGPDETKWTTGFVRLGPDG
jgi:hypothetical protein